MGWKLKTRKRNVTIGNLIETGFAFQPCFTRNHQHISDKFITGIEWIQSHRLAGKQLWRLPSNVSIAVLKTTEAPIALSGDTWWVHCSATPEGLDPHNRWGLYGPWPLHSPCMSKTPLIRTVLPALMTPCTRRTAAALIHWSTSACFVTYQHGSYGKWGDFWGSILNFRGGPTTVSHWHRDPSFSRRAMNHSSKKHPFFGTRYTSGRCGTWDLPSW